ncbi:hypothetical protein FKW77_006673 [Venturia effusa]|uniref:Uncharacterized protein n=1 Tax=Venturia effusa TaxID=50376 RepID=A0A517LDY3_9PEZI|nr:hypothetical protein FKW77_006673 [Venturia effusa]
MSGSMDDIRGPTPSPEPEPPQDDKVLPDARPQDEVVQNVNKGPIKLALPKKRGYAEANAGDEGVGGSETQAPKRRKKSVVPKEPKGEKDPKPKPTRRATKPAAKKPQHGQGVGAKNLSAVAQGKRPVDPADDEGPPDGEQGGEEMDNATIEEALKFAKLQERARFGAINDYQLSKRVRVKTGLVDSPMNENIAPGIPSREQRLLESFFIPFGSAQADSDEIASADNAVAQRRIDYITLYRDSPEDVKKRPRNDRKRPSRKDWRKLSLKHRLNVMEGLREIEEHEPKPRRKEWDTLRTQARHDRGELEKGQDWLDEPSSWDEYNDTHVTREPHRQPFTPNGGGKSDDGDNDDDNGSGDHKPSTIGNKKGKSATTKVTKTTHGQESHDWTEEHESYLQELLNLPDADENSVEKEAAEDDDEKVGLKDEKVSLEDEKEEAAESTKESTAKSKTKTPQEPRPPYTWLELEMIERFMQGRNQDGGGRWGAKTKNMLQLTRAHRLFFEKWPLPKDKKGKPYPPRQPQSMFRKLRKPEFEGRFTEIMGKGETKSSTVREEKGKGGNKNAVGNSKYAGKTVPGGKTLPGDEDNQDEDEDADDQTSPVDQKLNAAGRQTTARKGPAKAPSQIEVVAQDGGQDEGESLNEDETGEFSDEDMDVERDGGEGNDLDQELPDEDEDQTEETQRDDSGDSSGSDDLNDTRH